MHKLHRPDGGGLSVRKESMKARLIFAVLFLSCAMFAQSAQHSVTLSCSAPTSGGQVTGFNFYRGTASGGPYTLQNATPQASCSYADTQNLVEGQKYFYVATATGPGGESVNSNEVQALIPFSKPSPPTLAAPVVK